MTTSKLLVVVAMGILGACGASGPRETLPHTYRCDTDELVVSPAGASAPSLRAQLVHRGDNVDRYRDGDTELLVPHDHLADATLARHGKRTACVARGGYTDVITRYLRSESTHEVALQLQLDDDAVRSRIFTGWNRLGARYRRER